MPVESTGSFDIEQVVSAVKKTVCGILASSLFNKKAIQNHSLKYCTT